jgi:FkbM family methyltransferase
MARISKLDHWDNHYFSTFLFYAYAIIPETIIDVGVYEFAFIDRYKDLADTVIGFEPNKTRFEKIDKDGLSDTSFSSGMYNFSMVVNNIAISNKTGKHTFYEDLTNQGCSTLVGDILPGEHEVITYEVECDTLDNFFADYEKKINYIKIDTEWNDINVLYGGETIINKHRPIIQVHHYVPEMDEFFVKHNYKRIIPPPHIYKYYWVPAELKKWDYNL